VVQTAITPSASDPHRVDDSGARLDAVADRADVLVDVLALFHELGSEAGDLAELETLVFSTMQDLRRARAKSSEERLAPSSIARLEERLVDLEDALAEIDARVSTGSVRLVLESGIASPERTLRYARFLARHYRPTPTWSERLELVVRRCIATTGEDGMLSIAPWSEVEAKLWYIIGERRAKASARAGAASFFRRAIERLHEITLIDDLFDTGYCLDVLGYKVAIRETLLDPEVLYIVTELNVALSNKITSLISIESLGRKDIRGRMAEVRAGVNEVLGALDEEDRNPDEIDRNFDRSRARGGRLTWRSPSVWTAIVVTLFAALMVGGFVGVFKRSSRDQNVLVPAPEQTVTQLSAVLERGSFSQGVSKGMFVGWVDHQSWTAMTSGARKAESRELAKKLEQRGVQTALLYDDGAIVVQIDDGRVLFSK
jgi:hypothetical protein